MRSIELFTGGGGLALGVHRAGFSHLAVVELNHASCETLRLNHGRDTLDGSDWNVIEMDVHHLDLAEFPQDIDLLAAGAPCQPFSLGGKHAGESDSRNLFPEVFRAVRELRPRAFLLENVKGLTRSSFRPYYDYILQQLRFPSVVRRDSEKWLDHMQRLAVLSAVTSSQPNELAYRVSTDVFDMADFGVPQNRHRVFIVGFRSDLDIDWSFPNPTHSRDALLYAQYVDGSYWDEHGLQHRPVPGRYATRVSRLASSPRPRLHRWRTVRDAISDLPVPVMRQANPQFDSHIGIPDARVYKGHTGSPWDWPAKTIKAGDHGNPGGENMLADDDGTVRYFTVRELARLQTFPDDWRFAGSWSESRRQLGNAVPVNMATILARQIRCKLEHDGLADRSCESESLLVASD